GAADGRTEWRRQGGAARGRDLEEAGGQAAAARPVVAVRKAAAGLVGGHAAAVPSRPSPGQIARAQHVGVGCRRTIVLRLAIEEGAGNVGSEDARLNRAVVELRDLQVA